MFYEIFPFFTTKKEKRRKWKNKTYALKFFFIYFLIYFLSGLIIKFKDDLNHPYYTISNCFLQNYAINCDLNIQLKSYRLYSLIAIWRINFLCDQQLFIKFLFFFFHLSKILMQRACMLNFYFLKKILHFFFF